MPRETCLYKKERGRYLEIRWERLVLCGYDRCAAALMATHAYLTDVALEDSPDAAEGATVWYSRSKSKLRQDMLNTFGEHSIDRGNQVLADLGILTIRPGEGVGKPDQYSFDYGLANQLLKEVDCRLVFPERRVPNNRKGGLARHRPVSENADGENNLPSAKTLTDRQRKRLRASAKTLTEIDVTDSFDEGSSPVSSLKAIGKAVKNSSPTPSQDSEPEPREELEQKTEPEDSASPEPYVISDSLIRTVRSRLKQIKGLSAKCNKQAMAYVERALEANPSGLSEDDLFIAIGEWGLQDYWRGYDSPLSALIKFLSEYEPAKAPAKASLALPVAKAPAIAPAPLSASLLPIEIEEWNELVTAAPPIPEWRPSVEPQRMLDQCRQLPEFGVGWQSVLLTCQKIHVARGSEASWLTPRWLLKKDKNSGVWNWYRVLTGEMNGLIAGSWSNRPSSTANSAIRVAEEEVWYRPSEGAGSVEGDGTTVDLKIRRQRRLKELRAAGKLPEHSRLGCRTSEGANSGAELGLSIREDGVDGAVFHHVSKIQIATFPVIELAAEAREDMLPLGNWKTVEGARAVSRDAVEQIVLRWHGTMLGPKPEGAKDAD